MVRVRVSVTGSVSYLNENCSLHTLLLSAPAIHRPLNRVGVPPVTIFLFKKINFLCLGLVG